MDRPWYFLLNVDWSTGNVINGKKFYATAEGCLIIHPDGRTVQYLRNSWFDDNDFVN